MAATSYDVLIVGGGTAGITVAAQLRRKTPELKIAIFDPAQDHYYQPIWTLVGAGAVPMASSRRSMASVIPPGVTWVPSPVAEFFPERNELKAAEDKTYGYRYLVVCPGIQIDWHKVEGLPATLGKNGVCSNYAVHSVEKTWEFIRNFKGGTALFTFPNTLVKCAGAPQKIMYLAEHYFRKQGIRDNCRIVFATAGAKIFGVEKYAKALTQICKSRGIETLFGHNLEKIDGKTAYFRTAQSPELVPIAFEMLHVGPPMSVPDFIKKSPLVGQSGWVDVEKFTTRHVKYPNVFSLGDASSLPTSKTGAAIRKQAPVFVSHLLASLGSKSSKESYNGYTSCPLVTGYGKLILAEFDYDGKPAETFPFDQGKERLSMYLLKKYGLPALYWHGMLKGRA